MARVVAAEALDHLAPDDPEAMRSRRDLARVHRAMGTRSIIRGGWRSLVSPPRAAAPLRILELGAGDGTLLLGVARSLTPGWPRVQLSLLDRQDIVTPATLAGFAKLGWAAQVHVADVLTWAARPDVTSSGLPSPPSPSTSPSTSPSPSPSSSTTTRWDLITTSLFLHHFEGAQLDLLLAAVAARCDRFHACEPGRSWLALAGSHLVGAIGANAVTRADAVLSVRAGFRRDEISARWPRAGVDWQLRESAAGLFSHSFSAHRSGAAQ